MSSGMSGLTNVELDLIGRIAKRAETALTVLLQTNDTSLALDCAFDNGATIEKHLGELVESLLAVSALHRANANSSAGIFQESLLRVQSIEVRNGEMYRAEHVVPPLPDNLHLEFNSLDENGKHCAPEGHLKSTVMKSTSSGRVTAARGAESPVHGASGMAGVGKTTSLIALGHDRDVRNHFRDGVLYMSIGADASVAHITRGISKIMKFTGAKSSASDVEHQLSLSKAVEDAALWFWASASFS